MKKLPSILRSQIFLNFPMVIVILFSFLSMSTVTAQTNKDLAHAKVIDAVESYVFEQLRGIHEEGLEVKAMPIDARIDIPQCPSGLIASASEEALRQSNVTVKAECKDNGWYLYLVVKAVQMQPVVVLTDVVSPGTLLTENNLAVVKMDKKLLRTSTFADINDVVGARLKRRTRAGQPVVPNQLCFVCKGDSVLITADIQGLEIKTKGIAQQDGNLGDTIAVRNSNSQKLVRGKVTDLNQISVQI